MDDGYGREIAFAVDMKVMPSISVDGYEVYEFNKHPSCCCLCFDVDNHASVDMKFQVFINETKGKVFTSTLLTTNKYFEWNLRRIFMNIVIYKSLSSIFLVQIENYSYILKHSIVSTVVTAWLNFFSKISSQNMVAHEKQKRCCKQRVAKGTIVLLQFVKRFKSCH